MNHEKILNHVMMLQNVKQINITLRQILGLKVNQEIIIIFITNKNKLKRIKLKRIEYK